MRSPPDEHNGAPLPRPSRYPCKKTRTIAAIFCENPLFYFSGAVPGQHLLEGVGAHGASLWSCP
jgi:hypothetical protein